ncbi:MAG TPA: helix-turn-helix transcriptional regulator [Stellaceae bacterium]|jgi:transcriptional regulator with XRE-family HTH domain|nr:helix-turn-helix transcriptional regulator [Stellaceae bacterium]
MVHTIHSQRPGDLGAFLRAQRERLSPASLGLTGVTRRRTPGLRREEVAQLCGLSTTWYTWIEQGRDVSVSPAALARLADALRLGYAERTYLFELAGKRDPQLGGSAHDDIPPSVLACITAIATPAYLLDRLWNARGWNVGAERLFTGWLDRPGERNLLRFIFLESAARSLICGWDERARRVVAEFRAHCGSRLSDAPLQRLITALRGDSAEFAQFWDQHGVLGREGGERTFNHPQDGFLRYEQVTFDLATDADVKLTILVAAQAMPRGAPAPPP